ncbi:MAG: hypothetical protein SP1CHLAM54_10710 [Chlamydiia bacterium]|nr:hypothetical protein [Chlamydiia bacterium]MCH9615976.1 hypothetical protein [Chlamydiia bacterium]MCH9628621.1 hypothetical protein [Chlamydiia bacterium]
MDNGWKSQYGFIWAVLGSVVGFANVLSFSSQCYHNGGGAFLIPYVVAYMMLGIPMLLMEGLVGQKTHSPLVSAYKTKVRKFVGWIAVLSCLTIGAFYIVLTSYSLLYTYFGAANLIPADTSTFFKESFIHATTSLSDFGSFSYLIFAVVLLIAAFVWFTLVRDISEGVEKVCSFIMPLMTVLIVGFAIAASFLPGAMDGIYQFIRPDFSRLTDITLWRSVFGQLFFSLSLGLGIIVGYAQYNGEKIELKKSMLLIGVGDFLISFIAGWVVFACVGYMCYLKGVPFHSLIQSDSPFEIGFIIFPTILKTFTPWLQPVLAAVFFFCIFIAGITGVFSIVESVAGNVQREFAIPRKKAVSIAIASICALGTLFCMGNGQLLIGALEPMTLGLTMIFSALVEILVFLYVTKIIRDDVIWFNAKGRRNLMYYMLKFFVPCVLTVILVGAVINEFQNIDASFFIRWSWAAGAMLISFALVNRSKELELVAA